MRVLFLVAIFSFSNFVFSDDFYGVVYSNSKIEQSMEDSGTVKRVNVKLGQEVKKGDVLVILESSIQELEQQRNRLTWKDTKELDTQTRRLDILRRKRDMAESLYAETRSISRDELDNLHLELIQAEGRIDQIKEQKLRDEIEYHLSRLRLDKRYLRAAIDGVIISLSAKEGEWIKAGEPILSVIDTVDLYVNLNVPNHVARQLNSKSSVAVTVENMQNANGYIDYISPVADAASGLVEVRVKLNNNEKIIRPGIKASVKF